MCGCDGETGLVFDKVLLMSSVPVLAGCAFELMMMRSAELVMMMRIVLRAAEQEVLIDLKTSTTSLNDKIPTDLYYSVEFP